MRTFELALCFSLGESIVIRSQRWENMALAPGAARSARSNARTLGSEYALSFSSALAIKMGCQCSRPRNT